MTSALTLVFVRLAPLAVLGACGTESPELPTQIAPARSIVAERSSAQWSAWSTPVNLGAPVNSAANDQAPTLSKDGLALYFSSTRLGGVGNFDLWVSRRASRNSAWETPVNLGPVINTSLNEGGADLSPNGRMLFFQRNPPIGGQADIYVSHRTDIHDDLGWGAPVLLGPDVNTAVFEVGPFYVRHGDDANGEDGAANLYFTRGTSDVNTRDLYVAPVTRQGEPLGPAVLVSELSYPEANDGFITGRADGKEVFFDSTRPGAVGGTGNFDLWTSTRQTVHDNWATPVNMGEPVNTTAGEFQPDLSHDGRTLLFVAGPARGGSGGFDIWMSARTRHP